MAAVDRPDPARPNLGHVLIVETNELSATGARCRRTTLPVSPPSLASPPIFGRRPPTQFPLTIATKGPSMSTIVRALPVMSLLNVAAVLAHHALHRTVPLTQTTLIKCPSLIPQRSNNAHQIPL